MDEKTKERLRRAGWKVGTIQECLGLSESETAEIELRTALSKEPQNRSSPNN